MTGVQTCALPISRRSPVAGRSRAKNSRLGFWGWRIGSALYCGHCKPWNRNGFRRFWVRNRVGSAHLPNRDPIGEHGGMNLYECLGADPLDKYDYLGLVEKIQPAGLPPEFGPGGSSRTGWCGLGNAPVAQPVPPSTLPVCFKEEVGFTRRFQVFICPCSGARYYTYERCQLNLYPGTSQPVPLVGMDTPIKHIKLS